MLRHRVRYLLEQSRLSKQLEQDNIELERLARLVKRICSNSALLTQLQTQTNPTYRTYTLSHTFSWTRSQTGRLHTFIL